MTAPQPASRAHDASQLHPALTALGVKSRWMPHDASTVFAFEMEEGTAKLELRTRGSGQGADLVARGESEPVQKTLRNILLGQGVLVAEPDERVILDHYSPSTTSHEVLGVVAAWIQYLQMESSALLALKNGGSHPARNPVPGFWWDKRSNFGDAIGPWIISSYTGRPVVNARFMDRPERTLVSVGSVIQMVRKPRADIWGSGLIREINEKHLQDLKGLQDVRVHAVRGKLTREQLVSHLGWEVPEVYGDPALLLPRVYRPKGSGSSRSGVSFVPHYSHRKWLGNLRTQDVDVVDVRDDLTTVIDQIAGSEVCISTSLHGLIIAQAYGVPWIWLNITDESLAGARFKFDDYFSTLDRTAVAESQLTSRDFPELDLAEVAKEATLPRLQIDLDLLEQALPLDIVPGEQRSLPEERPVFSWAGYTWKARISAFRPSLAHRARRRLRRTFRRSPSKGAS